jgi:hypothetical protein
MKYERRRNLNLLKHFLRLSYHAIFFEGNGDAARELRHDGMTIKAQPNDRRALTTTR